MTTVLARPRRPAGGVAAARMPSGSRRALGTDSTAKLVEELGGVLAMPYEVE